MRVWTYIYTEGMSIPRVPIARTGYEPGTTPSERRANFDLDRRILDRTAWGGTWKPGKYPENAIVRDGDWLAVCSTVGGCTERPAPYPIGDPFNVYQGTAPTAAVLAKQTVFGNRYTWDSSGYLLGWRLYTIAGNEYTIYSIADPEGLGVFNELASFVATSTGWFEASIATIVASQGTTFDLIAVVLEPDPTPTTFTFDWDYFTPQNPGIPASGVISHANSASDQLRVNKTDNGGTPRSTELAGIGVGDVIEALGVRWSVQSVTDNGTWINFGVAPAVQVSPDGSASFTFETVSATPITYMSDTGYWATSPYSTLGLLGETYADAVFSDTAYGVDLLVQKGTVSDQWDVLSAGGSGGSGGDIQYLDELLDVNVPTPSGQQVLTYNDLLGEWEARTPIASLGLAAFVYTFKTATDGTPGAGQIELNNADPALATEMYIHEIDSNGADIALFLEYLLVGSWCNIGERDDYQAHHHSYDVTAATTENGQIWTVPLTLFESVGGAFPNNEKINLVLRYVTASGGGDYLPLSGGTLTGDLQVDGNTLAKINVPADAWGVGDGTVFAAEGMVGGTQGAFATAMTSNGYRNTSGGWTSLGLNGNAGAATIELHPTGGFYVRTTSTMGTGSTAPPVSFGVIDGLTRTYYDLQVDGNANFGASENFKVFENGTVRSTAIANLTTSAAPNVFISPANNSMYRTLWTPSTMAFASSKLARNSDVLERAETATLPPEIETDDDGNQKNTGEVEAHDTVQLFDVVTALLAKVKELSARIEGLESA